METPNTNTTSTPVVTTTSSYKSIDELLKLAKIAIDNTKAHADLNIPLAKKGYDSAELTAAQALYIKAEEMHLSKQDKYGDKLGAKDEFDALWDEIDDEYTDHVALARIALKNNRGDLEKLQLNTKRKQSISGWIGQAKAFYTNALATADIKAALAKKGVTEAELTAVKAKLDTLEAKEAAKFEKKGNAQNATSDRDNAIDELLDWYGDFVKVAKIAFKKTPQLLEKLGVVS